MKVLHITNNYPTKEHPIFGIFVKEQIDSLTKLGIENVVLFINGREKGKTEYLKSIFYIRKYLWKNEFDIIHCHHAFSAICFIFSGRSRKFKSIVSYQNDPSNEQGGFLYKIIKKYSNAIILKNNPAIIDNKNIFYQPNGVNISLFRPISRLEACKKLGLDYSKKYILFVSSNFIRKQKRYDRFQEVLEILRIKYKMDNIEELKLINTRRELVPYFFNAANLHLLTSDFEGSPNSVKEAMACNTPVVSTDVGNVKTLLEGVEGSYVVQTNTPEKLADLAYKALTLHVEIRSRRVLIERKLDIESVAKNIITIYKSI